MLRHHLLSLGSLAALGLLIGCDEASVVSPSAGSSLPLANARPLPWKESYRASGTIAPDVRCPAPLLLESDEGGGTATHIGKYTIVNSHCVDPGTGALTDGSFVKTAPSGDQLFGTYSGTATVIQVPAPIGIFRVSGTVSFTGGTGQFAGANGTTTMFGTEQGDFSQAPVPTKVTLTMVGTISY